MGLTDHQREFQKLASDFAKNELAPEMQKWDQEVFSANFNYCKWFELTSISSLLSVIVRVCTVLKGIVVVVDII